MDRPIIVFDHVRREVSTVTTGPDADHRLNELIAELAAQILTSGRPTK
jgi:hypothetical protein